MTTRVLDEKQNEKRKHNENDASAWRTDFGYGYKPLLAVVDNFPNTGSPMKGQE